MDKVNRDGVDVSECEHLTEIQGCWVSTCDYLPYKGTITNQLCKYNNNCYYKQLKRKEQFLEEIEKEITTYRLKYDTTHTASKLLDSLGSKIREKLYE